MTKNANPQPAPLRLSRDLAVQVATVAMWDAAAGLTTAGDGVDKVLATFECADLSTVTPRCLRCGNEAHIIESGDDIECGVGCGQPMAGFARQALRATLIESVELIAAAGPGATFSADVYASLLVSARIIDGDDRTAAA